MIDVDQQPVTFTAEGTITQGIFVTVLDAGGNPLEYNLEVGEARRRHPGRECLDVDGHAPSVVSGPVHRVTTTQSRPVARVELRRPPLRVTAHSFTAANPEQPPSLQACALCTLHRRNRHHDLDDPSLFSPSRD